METQMARWELRAAGAGETGGETGPEETGLGADDKGDHGTDSTPEGGALVTAGLAGGATKPAGAGAKPAEGALPTVVQRALRKASADWKR